MKRSHRMTCGAVAVLSLLAMPAAAGADTVGTIFERPAFTPGNLNGQGGWLNTGGFDAAIVANSGPAAAAFGGQSLRISNARTSGSFGDQTFSPPLVDGAGEPTSAAGGQAGGERQPHFDTTFRFMSATPGAEQPGLAVTVSPDSGSGGRMSFVRLRDTSAGVAVDFVDVPSAQLTGGHVDFREVQAAQGLDRAVPHSVRISMDFVPGANNDVVKVYVDDVLRVTGSSWENYYRNDVESGPSNNVPVVDQLLLRVSSTAHPELQGQGFLIDDVSTRSYSPGGTDGIDGVDGTDGSAGLTGSAIVAAGQPGAPGKTGANGTNGSPSRGTAVAVRILSSRLDRRTGVASVRLRCPAAAGICSGNVSLTNGRGVLVRRTYDLSSLEAGTLRIRFATGKLTATARKRSAVKLTVFSRDQQGLAARVHRTLR